MGAALVGAITSAEQRSGLVVDDAPRAGGFLTKGV